MIFHNYVSSPEGKTHKIVIETWNSTVKLGISEDDSRETIRTWNQEHATSPTNKQTSPMNHLDHVQQVSSVSWETKRMAMLNYRTQTILQGGAL